MTTITLEVPEALAKRLQESRGDLPRMLELGLHEYESRRQSGFVGAAALLEFLASLPTPEEVLAYQPTSGLESRVSELLERNRISGLDAGETEEWAQYESLEHLMRLAKARAYEKLHAAA